MGVKPGPLGTGRHTSAPDLVNPTDQASATEDVIQAAASHAAENGNVNAAQVASNLAIAQSNLAIAAALTQINMTLRRAHDIHD